MSSSFVHVVAHVKTAHFVYPFFLQWTPACFYLAIVSQAAMNVVVQGWLFRVEEWDESWRGCRVKERVYIWFCVVLSQAERMLLCDK